MATKNITDLFDCRTLHIIAGSQEFFFLSLYGVNMQGEPQNPLDLSTVTEIEWLFAPYSVWKEKSVAMVRKKWSVGDIIIIRDGSDGRSNLIQVTVKSSDTENLQGAFLHQIVVTDGAGTVFVPFEGIININRRIRVQ